MAEYTYTPVEFMLSRDGFEQDPDSVRDFYKETDVKAAEYEEGLKSMAGDYRSGFCPLTVGLDGIGASSKTTWKSSIANNTYPLSIDDGALRTSDLVAPEIPWPPPGQTYGLGRMGFGFKVERTVYSRKARTGDDVVSLVVDDVPGQATLNGDRRAEAVMRFAGQRLSRAHVIVFFLDCTMDLTEQVKSLSPRLRTVDFGQLVVLNFSKGECLMNPEPMSLTPHHKHYRRILDTVSNISIVEDVRRLVRADRPIIINTTYAAEDTGAMIPGLGPMDLRSEHRLGGGKQLLDILLREAMERCQ